LKRIITGILLLAVLTMLAGLVGCGGDTSALEQQVVDLEQQVAGLESASPEIKEVPTGISQEDYDRVVAELNAANTKIENLEAAITDFEKHLEETTTPDAEKIETDVEEPESSVGYSRSNPAAFGAKLYIETDELFRDDGYELNITLLEVIRGEEAWLLINELNVFASRRPLGFEHVLVKIRVKYLKGSTPDEIYKIRPYDFAVISSEGKELERVYLLIDIEPTLDSSIYPGVTHEGWGIFEVEKQDNKPLLTFGRDYQGGGGIWWQLY